MSLLCLDVGGSSIKYALCSQSGQLSSSGKVPTPFNSFEEFGAAVKWIVQRFNSSEVEGVAISLPGRVDSVRGYCYSGGYLSYNARREVGPELEKLLGLKVTLENDAKAATRAELWCGALKGVQSGAVLVMGTGLGGGIVVNGKLHAGPTGASGELSFMSGSLFEQTGLDGIASNIVSGTGLQVLAAQAYNLPYKLDLKEGFDLPMTGLEIFSRIEKGEEPAIKALKEFGLRTGRLVINLSSVIDVQKVAIGGGISAQPSLIKACREGTHKAFESMGLPPEVIAISEPEICACRFRNDANLLGAAHCFAELTGYALNV